MNDFAISCQNITLEYQLLTHRYSGLKDLLLHPSKYLQSKKRFLALKDVTVEIPRGQSVALIGHNGCGKSTLLKAIAGVISPQTGNVKVLGRIGPMIELGAGFDPELSGLENIHLSCMLMGLSRREIEERLPSIIAFADLGDFIHAPIKNYSSGMTARIGFACATAIDPDILLVDEVLSVGDRNFSLKCLARINELRKLGTTVVLVSHDMAAVKTFCERAIVMEAGCVLYDGSVEEGVHFHMDIMLERLSSTTPEDVEKRRSLRFNALTKQRPSTLIQAAVTQDGQEVSVLDVGKSFELKLNVEFKKSEHIQDGLTFGIAIIRRGDILTGFNNLDLKFGDPASIIRGNHHVEVTYSFKDGLPELAAQTDLDVVCGIHDNHISREIYFGTVLKIAVLNSQLGDNPHKYIVDLKDRVTSFQVSPR